MVSYALILASVALGGSPSWEVGGGCLAHRTGPEAVVYCRARTAVSARRSAKLGAAERDGIGVVVVVSSEDVERCDGSGCTSLRSDPVVGPRIELVEPVTAAWEELGTPCRLEAVRPDYARLELTCEAPHASAREVVLAACDGYAAQGIEAIAVVGSDGSEACTLRPCACDGAGEALPATKARVDAVQRMVAMHERRGAGDLEGALSLAREGLAAALAAGGPQDPLVGEWRIELGILLSVAGLPAEAEPELVAGLALVEGLADEALMVARARAELGAVRFHTGRSELAARDLMLAIEGFDALGDPVPALLDMTLLNATFVVASRGDGPAAEALLLRWARRVPADHPQLGALVAQVGHAHAGAGAHGQAALWLERAARWYGEFAPDARDDRRTIHDALAESAAALGRLEEAEGAWRAAADLATSVDARVFLLDRIGAMWIEHDQPDRAAAVYAEVEASLAGREAPCGPCAVVRGRQATLAWQRGDPAAGPSFEAAADELEAAWGPGAPFLAVTLNNYAGWLGDRDAPEMLEVAARAIRAADARPDELEPRIFTRLTWIDQAALDGDYAAARDEAERAVALARPDHPLLGAALARLGQCEYVLGDVASGRRTLEEAVTAAVRSGRADDERIARANLGGLLADLGELGLARAELLAALGLAEGLHGPDSPQVAITRLAVAAVSEFPASERHYLDAISVLDRAGHDTLVVASWVALAELYVSQGLVSDAERALGRAEPLLPPGDGLLRARWLGGAAMLHFLAGDAARARAATEEMLAIQRRILGEGHPSVAAGEESLGLATLDQPSVAVEHFERALAIREALLGPDHPALAQTLLYRGLARLGTGDVAGARADDERAVALLERALGADAPGTEVALEQLAIALEAQGEIDAAVVALERSVRVKQRSLARLLTAGTELQKREALGSVSDGVGFAVTLALRTGRPDVARLAFEAVVALKGRALDAQLDGLAVLRARAGPEERALLDALAATHQELAGEVVADDPDPEAVRALEDRALALEQDLAARMLAFSDLHATPDVGAIAHAIPRKGALVEYVRYYAYPDYGRGRLGGEERYAAFVLTRAGDLHLVDLGPAAIVDQRIVAMLDDLRACDGCRGTRVVAARAEAAPDPERVAREVDDSVLAPLRPFLDRADLVVVAPDGLVQLLPFEALRDEDGRYEVERHLFVYAGSSRDLVRMGEQVAPRGGPVVVAAPAYGPVEPGGPSWSDLPGAAAEAEAIAAVLGNVTSITGPDATEAFVRSVRGPSILHVATHGYFLPDVGAPRGWGEARATADPMLRAGLVFAGANGGAGDGASDGILTAKEAVELDLVGTRLVVLSACETAVGEVDTGNGVYGLRRALVMAGAETLVLSLWPVSDDATRELMTRYYGYLSDGEGRAEALRLARLDLLASERWSHPSYWAAFISSGDWRPIERGRR